jgi:hypothetical protein
VVYFSDKAVEPSRIDREQFARLAELRVQYQKSGLLGAFDSSEQLRRLVPGALAVHVASLMNRSTVGAARPGFLSTPPPYVRVSIDAVTLHTSLGPEAPSVAPRARCRWYAYASRTTHPAAYSSPDRPSPLGKVVGVSPSRIRRGPLSMPNAN